MATSVDRIFGYSSLSAFRLPVRVATTANITLSGEQTVDGVSVVAGDRVLVKDQTDGTENGVYVAATGAWTRAEDFDGARDVVEGTMILCNNGSANVGKIFRLTTSSPTIGTSSLTFIGVITLDELSSVLPNVTLSESLTITGATSIQADVTVSDDIHVSWGDVFFIETDGTNTTLTETGAGNLRVRAENFGIYTEDGSEAHLFCTANAGVTLYWDNGIVARTVLGGFRLDGDLTIAETADHSRTPVAGFGNFWVRSDTPNVPIFTDDSGADYDLTSRVKIGSTVVISSDAAVDFTLDASKFRSFEIELTNVIPATDAVDLYLLLSNDGGSTFIDDPAAYSNAVSGEVTVTTTAIVLTFSGDLGSATGENGLSGTIKVHNPGAASYKTMVESNMGFINSSGTLVQRSVFSIRTTAETNDAIRFIMSSGALESGEVALFGVK